MRATLAARAGHTLATTRLQNLFSASFVTSPSYLPLSHSSLSIRHDFCSSSSANSYPQVSPNEFAPLSLTNSRNDHLKIKRIAVFKAKLPLHEGSYKWSTGKFVDVFDATIVQVETQSVSGVGEQTPLGPFYLPGNFC